MDYLVIKAIIWIFFITSAILEVNYKKKHGELDKRARKQATLGTFLIVTTIFDEGYENKILYTIVLIALLVYIILVMYRLVTIIKESMKK
ncbi:hypothetical protein [Ligilactobacillus salivarius]|uniref:hypothetical protein n=1 Tax=Ligilactobacillus salivarius TaxID=1624 RepID=UPI00202380EF|nr:hypothetical protein [Ligilactobacillus salivarius]URI13678.1 hypothetical protein M9Y03_08365 [Ligilactobacillus salivarius]UUB35522.1 hypothetical protein NO469_08505 [Ligilactobacillus salivarius]